MKTFTPNVRSRSAAGFTLLELSFVMALILSLCVGIGFGVSAIQKWKKGKNGSLALQAVYAAQRAYMADHPTANVALVTSTQLTAYLPQGWTAMPVVTGQSDETLSVDITVMPPRLLLGSSPYDPSARTNDGLWDTGD